MNRKYLKSTNLYSEATRRLAELKEISNRIEEKLAKYPEGKIHIITNNNKAQFYLREESGDKSGKYMSKKSTSQIKLFVQKRYEEEILKRIADEIECLILFLNTAKYSGDDIRNIYSSRTEEIKSYISPVDVSDEDYVKEWLAVSYTKKPISEESVILKSNNGDYVRSKSELNIANALYKRGIPYKYECPIVLRNGITVHPDFTVLDVKRRREVYWEHRGMMDDREYMRHAIKKNKDYLESGIILGDSLIITEETSIMPLGTNEIEAVIEYYFETDEKYRA